MDLKIFLPPFHLLEFLPSMKFFLTLNTSTYQSQHSLSQFNISFWKEKDEESKISKLSHHDVLYSDKKSEAKLKKLSLEIVIENLDSTLSSP